MRGALAQDAPSAKLHDLIDWHEISHKLKGLYKRELTHGGGPEPYAALSMFKLMLLGQWHNLSDPQSEQALKMRIDFMVFTGLEPTGCEMPDATTICRFRNRLVSTKLDQVLLRVVNRQLESRGLKVAGSRGAILDATIIDSAERPDRHIEVDDEGQADVVDSADTGARWVKKGNESFFGFRGYAVVDTEDGYVKHVQVHPANQAEVSKLPEIVDTLVSEVAKPVAVLAGKGYASATNRAHLQQHGIADLIQHKSNRGHPVHPLYTQLNGAIASPRYKVEKPSAP